ncbi:MAG TPA: DUF3570 domain-containing protein [Gammaproteobacteria bacterium]|nr:DUF3570 domain-containing protein [Gammaproteobacteria bacterium]
MAVIKTRLKPTIKQQLALATCGLLSQQQAAAEAVENDWVFDSSFLNYRESDDRVSVEKFIMDVSGNIAERDHVDLGVVLDTMTGSTPTGAVETSTVSSVTGTSGSGGFTASGAASAMAPFDDTRLAVKLDWDREASSSLHMIYGAAVSVENDYNSMGGSINIKKETADKLKSFTAGIAFSRDTISQTGGVTPDPMSDVSDQRFFGEGERNTFELMGGVTGVVNERTVWQNNLTLSFSDGYHSDPYKVISVANDDDVELTRLYESRPDSRQRTAFYSKLVHQLRNGQTFHLSYRYYSDDWDIKAHTVEYIHHFELAGGQYIEPNIRAYRQTKAEFFHRSLPLFSELPQYASADYRLDALTDYTLGVKFGKPVGDDSEIRARIEFFSQEAEDAVINENQAVFVQISYKKGFF